MLPSPSVGTPQRGLPASSAPFGGWKTTMSPTDGSPKRMPMRFTSTRWPMSSVGSIEPLGMR